MHGVQSRCIPPSAGSSNSTARCPTSFPNANTLGPTFNVTLYRSMGSAIGLELRALWLQNVPEQNWEKYFPHIGLDCWSPNVNIIRDPRWGRNVEAPSEDPYLSGMYGMMHILGLQEPLSTPRRHDCTEQQQHQPHSDGNSKKTEEGMVDIDDNKDGFTKYPYKRLKAVATVKHFAANSLEGPYWTPDGTFDPSRGHISRHSVNSRINLYDLHSTYFRAFKMAIVEGGAAGIMCSYNRINGVPTCVNEDLLRRVLRREWKFEGYITSDTNAIEDVFLHHNYTSSWEETVALALRAGCDVDSSDGPHERPHFSTGSKYIDHLADAVRNGWIKESLVDEALRNTLKIRFQLGLFDYDEEEDDNDYYWNVPPSVVKSGEHVKLAKEATGQGLVLLKNDDSILPIFGTSTTTETSDPVATNAESDTTKKSNDGVAEVPSTIKTIALIGPHIDDRHVMLGNYLGEICFEDPANHCVESFHEGFVHVAEQINRGSTCRKGEERETRILVAKGCDVFGSDESHFGIALDVAQQADAVVFIGGLNSELEGEELDRPDIRIPHIQSKLIKEVSAVNPNIVLVLIHGGVVALDDDTESSVKAIVSAGYPGMYAGRIIPEALLGQRTHSTWGKLAVTWYKHETMTELNMLDFDMSRPPGRTYRYYTGKPMFEFGYGLNPLTTFELSNLTLSAISFPSTSQQNHSPKTSMTTMPTSGSTARTIQISLTVSNVGRFHRGGDEVLLAYFRPADATTIPKTEPSSALIRQLFAFERIHLVSGETKQVSSNSFIISPSALTLHDALGMEVLYPGRYIIEVSNGIQTLSTTIRLKSDGLFEILPLPAKNNSNSTSPSFSIVQYL